jgi:acyl-homoserine lactone acylase PvdQ
VIRRAASGLAIGAALAVVSLLATGGLLFYRPLPTVDGYFRLLGLNERVEVLRDAMGIPHLYASDAHDLFFLQGYVTAQDRLAQLEQMRLVARAERGPAARLAVDRASPSLRAALEAYAAGITKLVAQYSTARALPGELVLAGDRPAPWEPADSLAVAGTYLERIAPTSVCASVAAARTLKGRPLLAADLYLSAPDPVWYEIGLDGGGFRAVGLSIPGVPGIVAGHNGWVAWSLLSSARGASDPVRTLSALLAALPSRSARTFGDAMRESAVASCLADIEGRVGGTDRGQVSFVPAERPGVLGGDGGRAAELGRRLESARGVDIESLRTFLGRPVSSTGGARVIVDLAEVDTSRSAVSRGASGLRASPHFGDQAALWEIGALHRLPLSRGAITLSDGDLVLRAR